MSILDRIRAHGGDVARDERRIRLRLGRLTSDVLTWLKQPEIRDRLHREVWPQVDDWHERANELQKPRRGDFLPLSESLIDYGDEVDGWNGRPEQKPP